MTEQILTEIDPADYPPRLERPNIATLVICGSLDGCREVMLRHEADDSNEYYPTGLPEGLLQRILDQGIAVDTGRCLTHGPNVTYKRVGN